MSRTSGVVSRYLHLNPVRAGLVSDPAGWEGSSYPGYAHRRHRRDWVAYDELLAAWQGALLAVVPGPRILSG